MEDAEHIVKELLSLVGAPYTGVSRSTVAGQEVIAIQADDGKALIGPHGDVLHAIDTLTKKIYEKRHPPAEGEPPAFLVDVNDYQTKRIKDLQSKALMMAERARSFQYDVELSPMSSYERLIVHTTLADAPSVKTESQGEGRNRRVVIKYSPQ